MPTRDYNFTLAGVDFGIGNPVTVEAFDPGSANWRTQDVDNPTGDGSMFGRDYVGPPTWAFDMSVDATDPTTALDILASLAKVWRGDAWRTTPGAVAELAYQVGGRTRLVYGRPRNFAAPPDNLILSGYIPITADFVCIDPLHYEATMRSTVVDIVPASTGGFVTPLIAPISTLAGGHREGAIIVEGDVPTPPVIRIDGPITNPWVAAGGWRLDLALSLGDGEWVEIDARPWAMTVLRQGIAGVGGALGPTSRLSQVRLAPGGNDIIFGGVDASGTATCTVSWRPAWISL